MQPSPYPDPNPSLSKPNLLSTPTLTLYCFPLDYDHDAWFSAYVPESEDGCYIQDVNTGLADVGKEGGC